MTRSVPTSLYRYFDSEGRLLYVGITSTESMRMWQHSKHSRWWSRVATSSLEHYPDRDSACRAEMHAIESESPMFNVAHGSVANRFVQSRKRSNGTIPSDVTAYVRLTGPGYSSTANYPVTSQEMRWALEDFHEAARQMVQR